MSILIRFRFALLLCGALIFGSRLSTAATLYFTDPGFGDDVATISGDGSGFTDIFHFPAIADPRGLAVDSVSGKVYFSSGASILRGNVNGTGLISLGPAGGSVPTDLELDRTAGKVYWSVDGSTGGIRRASVDGSSAETLVTQTLLDTLPGVDPKVRADRISGLEIYDGRVYWANLASLNSMPLGGVASAADAISHFTLTSDEVTKLVIDASSGLVYFTSSGTSKVLRSTLGGGDLTTLVSRGFGRPGALAVDFSEDKIYFGDSLGTGGRGEILRTNLDGSDASVIFDRASTLFAPTDLELASAVPEPETYAHVLVGLGLVGYIIRRRKRT